MADWKGRGKGRNPGQPTNDFRGGAGQGSGRPGAQPSPDISGGPGRGGGRPGAQPGLKPAEGMPDAARSWSLKAVVNYGGASDARRPVSNARPTSPQRAGSTFKSASGENNPRVMDPEGNFIFSLEINGAEVAQFKEASGLKSTTAVFELEEGGMNQAVHKLPGQSRWGNIVLRYGVTNNAYLLDWRNRILQDDFADRRNGSIIMRTLQMEEVRRYNFVQAWPVGWDGPTFDAGAADLAIESIEIAHHGITVS
jgi:phage tail-like protein